jgi:hypothetical protein
VFPSYRGDDFESINEFSIGKTLSLRLKKRAFQELSLGASKLNSKQMQVDFVDGLVEWSNLKFKAKAKIEIPKGASDQSDLVWTISAGKNQYFDGIKILKLFPVQSIQGQKWPIILSIMSLNGIVTPRFYILDFFINSHRINKMIAIEYPTKESLEQLELMPGIVLKFDNKFPSFNVFLPSLDGVSNIHSQFGLALTQLNYYFHTGINLESIFDIKSWVNYVAIASIWGCESCLSDSFIKLYFDPRVNKFKPILYPDMSFIDQDPYVKNEILLGKFISKLMLDSSFFNLVKLKKMELEKQMALEHKILEKDLLEALPWWARNKKALLKEQYPRLLKMSSPDLLSKDEAHLFRLGENSLKIFFNHHDFQILNVFKVSINNGIRDELKFHLNKNEISVDPVDFNEMEEEVFLEVLNKKMQSQKYLKVQDLTHDKPLFNRFTLNDERPYEFLKRNGKIWSFRQGTWVINSSLVFPGNVLINFPPGVKLKMGSKATLIFLGDVKIEGTPSRPVIFAPSDDDWPGVAFLGGENKISNLVVKKTSGVRLDEWVLTGGVVFHEGNLLMEDSIFNGTKAEDALNIIKTKLFLRRITVKDTRSDSIDVDFGKGFIQGVEIINSGGDGLDFSGSKIQVTRANLRDIKDKAISIGENSSIKLHDVFILNSGTGVAVKDGSLAVIDNTRLNKISHIGLMAYLKKPYYSFPRVIADELIIDAQDREVLAQTGSFILMNGKKIETTDFDVDAIYKSGYMKK